MSKRKQNPHKRFFEKLKKNYEDPEYINKVIEAIRIDSESIKRNARVDYSRLNIRIGPSNK
jgi:hypothetical protein